LWWIETAPVILPSKKFQPLIQLKEGLNFARSHSIIAPLLILQGLVNILGIQMITTLLPAFANEAFHSPTVGYSALTSALGIGAIVGSLLNTKLNRRYARGKILGLLAILLPTLTILLSISPSLFIGCLIMVALGFGYSSFFITANVTVQTQAPEEMRGRVISLWALNRFGLAPIGGIVLGVIAELVGSIETLFGVSFVVIPLVIFTLTCAHAVRRLV
jgi:MFS family permease